MTRDTLFIITGWLIMIILLILFVPRNKIRHAYVIFTFKQLMTWILGLTIAELGLIEYPVRSFANATKTSFDFEYFIYPCFCVLFILHYPEKKSFWKQLLYYIYYCVGLTVAEVIVEEHTNLLEYINWSWYHSFIAFFITFFVSHKFYHLFFSEKERNI